MFAKVIFFNPSRKAFTYEIPIEFEEIAEFGKRVVVPFGKRTTTGIIISIETNHNLEKPPKKIIDILDDVPIITQKQLDFYKWISEYYISSLGEAIVNSFPGGTDFETKRKIVVSQDYCRELLKQKIKTKIRQELLEILIEKEVHSLSTLQKRLKRKNIYGILRTLEKDGAISIIDEIEKPKVKAKTEKYVRSLILKENIGDEISLLEKKSPKQAVLLLFIATQQNEKSVKEILEKTQTNLQSLKSLQEKNFIQIYEKEVERKHIETYSENSKPINLNAEQVNVISEVEKYILESEFQPFLLKGITGSGKTQVYIELTKSVIKNGKTAIILVPEISLTPQIASRFINEFGEKVAIFHSRISVGERYDVWRGVLKGKYSVIIGPRSALFTPLNNLGIVIVDEEHDSSYKQNEIVPKYHARDLAIMKAKIENIPVILGSATPSVETIYNAQIGKFKLLELTMRADNASLPLIEFVDLSQERKQKILEGSLSTTLISKIRDRIEKKEGVIILQNRRGFATNIFCQDCKNVETCPNCSVSLVHHIYDNELKCHYCGFKKPVPIACTNCGSISLNFYGVGIQKVEDELAFHFPNANIERADSDVINKKGKMGNLLKKFREKQIDILVGTQMVSKGLDIPHVTLVGVISAEATLWLPDFRADERTFQLLTQVAGRSGRSNILGEVVIQTENPKNFILRKVSENDYEGFIEREINLRKKNNYPPFTKFGIVESKSEVAGKANGAINDFYKILKKYENVLIINSPVEAPIHKLKGYFRFHIVLKSSRNKDPNGKIMRDAIFNSFIEFNQNSRFGDVKILIDIDPTNTM